MNTANNLRRGPFLHTSKTADYTLSTTTKGFATEHITWGSTDVASISKNVVLVKGKSLVN